MTLALPWSPERLALGDFDRDGRLDLAATYPDWDAVAVWLGDGTGGFPVALPLFATGARPIDVAAVDLDGDGWLDLVTTNVNSDDVSVLVN